MDETIIEQIKPKYKQNTDRILRYHMNANHHYIEGHAIIAGKLAEKSIKTYEQYCKLCAEYGIGSYNRQCFNDYMNIKS